MRRKECEYGYNGRWKRAGGERLVRRLRAFEYALREIAWGLTFVFENGTRHRGHGCIICLLSLELDILPVHPEPCSPVSCCFVTGSWRETVSNRIESNLPATDFLLSALFGLSWIELEKYLYSLSCVCVACQRCRSRANQIVAYDFWYRSKRATRPVFSSSLNMRARLYLFFHLSSFSRWIHNYPLVWLHREWSMPKCRVNDPLFLRLLESTTTAISCTSDATATLLFVPCLLTRSHSLLLLFPCFFVFLGATSIAPAIRTSANSMGTAIFKVSSRYYFSTRLIFTMPNATIFKTILRIFLLLVIDSSSSCRLSMHGVASFWNHVTVVFLFGRLTMFSLFFLDNTWCLDRLKCK